METRTNRFADLEASFASVAERQDFEQVTSYEEQCELEIMTNDGVFLVAEYREADDRLIVYTIIGETFEEGHEKNYLLFLKFNGTWRTNGGLRIAIDDDTDAVVLEMDIPASEVVQPVHLENVCKGFVSVSKHWRETIESMGRADVESVEVSPSIEAMRV